MFAPPPSLAARWSAGMFDQRLGAKTRAKLFIGGLLYPQSSARWLDFVQHSDILGGAIRTLPVAASKIYRPYLTRRLSCAARVSALIDHYAFLSRMGLGELVRQAALNDVELASLSCKSGELAQLDLSAVRDGHREGELCLKLRYRGVQIYAASLIFTLEQGQPQLMIGRLQGNACPEARDLVREATRDLFGARPGALLIALARHLAHQLCCARVVLVSNKNRIAINLWRRWHISADYDKLWAELGATRRPDGNFEITPLAAPDVDIEALPSKKRSEARKKLAMLEGLFEAAGERLGV